MNHMDQKRARQTLDQLVARSRRLGADRSVCNWGGGNTSAKSDETDFRGRQARVLWVKGSGSDLATCTEASFTGLYLDDITPLLERERMSDTEMVEIPLALLLRSRAAPSLHRDAAAWLPALHAYRPHPRRRDELLRLRGGWRATCPRVLWRRADLDSVSPSRLWPGARGRAGGARPCASPPGDPSQARPDHLGRDR